MAEKLGHKLAALTMANTLGLSMADLLAVETTQTQIAVIATLLEKMGGL
jgi:hypothetical protein